MSENKLTKEELARHYLIAYCKLMFPDYKVGNHHAIIADALERVERGECKRLMISMPPRHGKSQIASEFFPAWYLGRNPDKYIITATYSQDLANDFGRKVRNQLLDEYHQAAFPDCRLVDDSKAKNKFNTTAKGVYYAVGVGASATGRGAHLLLIDDPLKGRKEAESEVMRQGLKDWYTSVAYTRLMPGGAIIIIQTRWHEDDLAGWVSREHPHEGWEVLNLPAIDDNDQPLWPEQYPLETLLNIKRTIGSRDWEALYQQRPAASEGEIFKREWWRSYKELPKLKWIMQSWDTAYKKGAENDYSVCTTWGVSETGYHLIDLWKGKVEFPELKRTARNLAAKWNPRAILIEDKASGQSLIQELKTNSKLNIIAVSIDSDKQTRAYAVTPFIEAGNVYLPEETEWVQDFIDECAVFPNGVHDDSVDSMTMFLNYVRRRGEAAFKEFAEEAEKKQVKGHLWMPVAGTQFYKCDRCGVTVKADSATQAEQIATDNGMGQCKPTT